MDDASERGISRRHFLRTSAAVSAAAMTASSANIFGAGSEKIRIGLVNKSGSRVPFLQDLLVVLNTLFVLVVCAALNGNHPPDALGVLAHLHRGQRRGGADRRMICARRILAGRKA